MSGAGARVDAALGLLMPGLHAAVDRVWEVPEPDRIYPEFLVTTHHIIRASVPLMTVARTRCAELARHGADPVAEALIPYWEHHIAEERGHDTWVCEDLAALGHDPGRVWRRIPSGAVARLCGVPYLWIGGQHPVCLLGYQAVLEGSPPRPDVAEVLGARTGHPRAAFRTLARHAAADVGHGAELLGLLDELPLEERLSAAVVRSALHTVRSVVRVFEELVQPYAPATHLGSEGAR
ncbi:iron-containing redox enzyme family protein [Streptomyces kanamyceticus]|nr:iron-containing redox enzyme family protein [Streptomyces kanamyceticus]